MRHWDAKRRLWMPGLSKSMTIVVLLIALGSIFAVTQIDLTTQVKGILPVANGGTGSAFFGISGPTVARAYAFPDASTTVLTTNAAVTVAQGGTGAATLAAHGVVLGNGTTAVSVTGAGTSGQCFTSNGAAADPTFQTCPGGSSFADNATPTGTIDGTNATFTLANSPSPAASLQLFKNGQLMIAGGADYTLTGNSIVYVTGAKPKTGDVHVASYRF